MYNRSDRLVTLNYNWMKYLAFFCVVNGPIQYRSTWLATHNVNKLYHSVPYTAYEQFLQLLIFLLAYDSSPHELHSFTINTCMYNITCRCSPVKYSHTPREVVVSSGADGQEREAAIFASLYMDGVITSAFLILPGVGHEGQHFGNRRKPPYWCGQRSPDTTVTLAPA